MRTRGRNAFVVVGVYALGLAWADRRALRGQSAGYLARNPLFSALFGAGCIFLGIGSGIFHASLTRFGQQLDVASMYAPLLAMIALNSARSFERLPRWHAVASWGIAACAVLANVMLYIYKWQMSASSVLAVLILAIAAFLVVDVFRKQSSFLRRWLAFAAVSFTAAIIIRQLDVAGVLTGPDAWLQGHAIWHVLAAAGLGCVYMYYRSERAVTG